MSAISYCGSVCLAIKTAGTVEKRAGNVNKRLRRSPFGNLQRIDAVFVSSGKTHLERKRRRHRGRSGSGAMIPRAGRHPSSLSLTKQKRLRIAAAPFLLIYSVGRFSSGTENETVSYCSKNARILSSPEKSKNASRAVVSIETIFPNRRLGFFAQEIASKSSNLERSCVRCAG